MVFRTARFRRQLTRATLLLAFLAYVGLYARQKHDMQIREYPVDFSRLKEGVNFTTWIPESPMRWYNGTHIDDRYEKLRSLKSGLQGSVAVYFDIQDNRTVVVKTISADSRNHILPISVRHVFEEWTTTWPSEVEATLILGERTINGQTAFVPMHDYFLLSEPTSPPDKWTWAMVTPLMKRGNLFDVAMRVKGQHLTPDEIDEHYRRGSFDQILSDLSWLHGEGYCHDDMKPDNIFIPNSETWILGDVGNTRQCSHPWHSTRLFYRRNKSYAPNCQTDDARRALKAYMMFLREACHDRAQFDYDFLEQVKPWSKLYWGAIGTEMPARYALMLSDQNAPSSETGECFSGSLVPSLMRKLVVNEILKTNAPWWKFHIIP